MALPIFYWVTLMIMDFSEIERIAKLKPQDRTAREQRILDAYQRDRGEFSRERFLNTVNDEKTIEKALNAWRHTSRQTSLPMSSFLNAGYRSNASDAVYKEALAARNKLRAQMWDSTISRALRSQPASPETPRAQAPRTKLPEYTLTDIGEHNLKSIVDTISATLADGPGYSMRVRDSNIVVSGSHGEHTVLSKSDVYYIARGGDISRVLNRVARNASSFTKREASLAGRKPGYMPQGLKEPLRRAAPSMSHDERAALDQEIAFNRMRQAVLGGLDPLTAMRMFMPKDSADNEVMRALEQLSIKQHGRSGLKPKDHDDVLREVLQDKQAMGYLVSEHVQRLQKKADYNPEISDYEKPVFRSIAEAYKPLNTRWRDPGEEYGAESIRGLEADVGDPKIRQYLVRYMLLKEIESRGAYQTDPRMQAMTSEIGGVLKENISAKQMEDPRALVLDTEDSYGVNRIKEYDDKFGGAAWRSYEGQGKRLGYLDLMATEQQLSAMLSYKGGNQNIRFNLAASESDVIASRNDPRITKRLADAMAKMIERAKRKTKDYEKLRPYYNWRNSFREWAQESALAMEQTTDAASSRRVAGDKTRPITEEDRNRYQLSAAADPSISIRSLAQREDTGATLGGVTEDSKISIYDIYMSAARNKSTMHKVSDVAPMPTPLSELMLKQINPNWGKISSGLAIKALKAGTSLRNLRDIARIGVQAAWNPDVRVSGSYKNLTRSFPSLFDKPLSSIQALTNKRNTPSARLISNFITKQGYTGPVDFSDFAMSRALEMAQAHGGSPNTTAAREMVQMATMFLTYDPSVISGWLYNDQRNLGLEQVFGNDPVLRSALADPGMRELFEMQIGSVVRDFASAKELQKVKEEWGRQYALVRKLDPKSKGYSKAVRSARDTVHEQMKNMINESSEYRGFAPWQQEMPESSWVDVMDESGQATGQRRLDLGINRLHLDALTYPGAIDEAMYKQFLFNLSSGSHIRSDELGDITVSQGLKPEAEGRAGAKFVYNFMKRAMWDETGRGLDMAKSLGLTDDEISSGTFLQAKDLARAWQHKFLDVGTESEVGKENLSGLGLPLTVNDLVGRGLTDYEISSGSLIGNVNVPRRNLRKIPSEIITQMEKLRTLPDMHELADKYWTDNIRTAMRKYGSFKFDSFFDFMGFLDKADQSEINPDLRLNLGYTLPTGEQLYRIHPDIATNILESIIDLDRPDVNEGFKRSVHRDMGRLPELIEEMNRRTDVQILNFGATNKGGDLPSYAKIIEQSLAPRSKTQQVLGMQKKVAPLSHDEIRESGMLLQFLFSLATGGMDIGYTNEQGQKRNSYDIMGRIFPNMAEGNPTTASQMFNMFYALRKGTRALYYNKPGIFTSLGNYKDYKGIVISPDMFIKKDKEGKAKLGPLGQVLNAMGTDPAITQNIVEQLSGMRPFIGGQVDTGQKGFMTKVTGKAETERGSKQYVPFDQLSDERQEEVRLKDISDIGDISYQLQYDTVAMSEGAWGDANRARDLGTKGGYPSNLSKLATSILKLAAKDKGPYDFLFESDQGWSHLKQMFDYVDPKHMPPFYIEQTGARTPYKEWMFNKLSAKRQASKTIEFHSGGVLPEDIVGYGKSGQRYALQKNEMVLPTQHAHSGTGLFKPRPVQRQILEAVSQGKRLIDVIAYAGTGKTTVAQALVEMLTQGSIPIEQDDGSLSMIKTWLSEIGSTFMYSTGLNTAIPKLAAKEAQDKSVQLGLSFIKASSMSDLEELYNSEGMDLGTSTDYLQDWLTRGGNTSKTLHSLGLSVLRQVYGPLSAKFYGDNAYRKVSVIEPAQQKQLILDIIKQYNIDPMFDIVGNYQNMKDMVTASTNTNDPVRALPDRLDYYVNKLNEWRALQILPSEVLDKDPRLNSLMRLKLSDNNRLKRDRNAYEIYQVYRKSLLVPEYRQTSIDPNHPSFSSKDFINQDTEEHILVDFPEMLTQAAYILNHNFPSDSPMNPIQGMIREKMGAFQFGVLDEAQFLPPAGLDLLKWLFTPLQLANDKKVPPIVMAIGDPKQNPFASLGATATFAMIREAFKKQFGYDDEQLASFTMKENMRQDYLPNELTKVLASGQRNDAVSMTGRQGHIGYMFDPSILSTRRATEARMEGQLRLSDAQEDYIISEFYDALTKAGTGGAYLTAAQSELVRNKMYGVDKGAAIMNDIVMRRGGLATRQDLMRSTVLQSLYFMLEKGIAPEDIAIYGTTGKTFFEPAAWKGKYNPFIKPVYEKEFFDPDRPMDFKAIMDTIAELGIVPGLMGARVLPAESQMLDIYDPETHDIVSDWLHQAATKMKEKGFIRAQTVARGVGTQAEAAIFTDLRERFMNDRAVVDMLKANPNMSNVDILEALSNIDATEYIGGSRGKSYTVLGSSTGRDEMMLEEIGFDPSTKRPLMEDERLDYQTFRNAMKRKFPSESSHRLIPSLEKHQAGIKENPERLPFEVYDPFIWFIMSGLYDQVNAASTKKWGVKIGDRLLPSGIRRAHSNSYYDQMPQSIGNTWAMQKALDMRGMKYRMPAWRSNLVGMMPQFTHPYLSFSGTSLNILPNALQQMSDAMQFGADTSQEISAGLRFTGNSLSDVSVNGTGDMESVPVVGDQDMHFHVKQRGDGRVSPLDRMMMIAAAKDVNRPTLHGLAYRDQGGRFDLFRTTPHGNVDRIASRGLPAPRKAHSSASFELPGSEMINMKAFANTMGYITSLGAFTDYVRGNMQNPQRNIPTFANKYGLDEGDMREMEEALSGGSFRQFLQKMVSMTDPDEMERLKGLTVDKREIANVQLTPEMDAVVKDISTNIKAMKNIAEVQDENTNSMDDWKSYNDKLNEDVGKLAEFLKDQPAANAIIKQQAEQQPAQAPAAATEDIPERKPAMNEEEARQRVEDVTVRPLEENRRLADLARRNEENDKGTGGGGTTGTTTGGYDNSNTRLGRMGRTFGSIGYGALIIQGITQDILEQSWAAAANLSENNTELGMAMGTSMSKDILTGFKQSISNEYGMQTVTTLPEAEYQKLDMILRDMSKAKALESGSQFSQAQWVEAWTGVVQRYGLKLDASTKEELEGFLGEGSNIEKISTANLQLARVLGTINEQGQLDIAGTAALASAIETKMGVPLNMSDENTAASLRTKGLIMGYGLQGGNIEYLSEAMKYMPEPLALGYTTKAGQADGQTGLPMMMANISALEKAGMTYRQVSSVYNWALDTSMNPSKEAAYAMWKTFSGNGMQNIPTVTDQSGENRLLTYREIQDLMEMNSSQVELRQAEFKAGTIGLRYGSQNMQLQIRDAQLQINQAELNFTRETLPLQRNIAGMQYQASMLSLQNRGLTLGMEERSLTRQESKLDRQRALQELGWQIDDLQWAQQGNQLNRQFEGLGFNRWMRGMMYGTPNQQGALQIANASWSQQNLANQRSQGTAGLIAPVQLSATGANYGLQGEQFVAGIEHQRSQMVYGRSRLLSGAAFTENMEYLDKQKSFFERQAQLQEVQFEFEQKQAYASLNEQVALREAMLPLIMAQREEQRKQYEDQKADIADARAKLEMSKQELALQTSIVTLQWDLQQKQFDQQELMLDKQQEIINLNSSILDNDRKYQAQQQIMEAVSTAAELEQAKIMAAMATYTAQLPTKDMLKAQGIINGEGGLDINKFWEKLGELTEPEFRQFGQATGLPDIATQPAMLLRNPAFQEWITNLAVNLIPYENETAVGEQFGTAYGDRATLQSMYLALANVDDMIQIIQGYAQLPMKSGELAVKEKTVKDAQGAIEAATLALQALNATMGNLQWALLFGEGFNAANAAGQLRGKGGFLGKLFGKGKVAAETPKLIAGTADVTADLAKSGLAYGDDIIGATETAAKTTPKVASEGLKLMGDDALSWGSKLLSSPAMKLISKVMGPVGLALTAWDFANTVKDTVDIDESRWAASQNTQQGMSPAELEAYRKAPKVFNAGGQDAQWDKVYATDEKGNIMLDVMGNKIEYTTEQWLEMYRASHEAVMDMKGLNTEAYTAMGKGAQKTYEEIKQDTITHRHAIEGVYETSLSTLGTATGTASENMLIDSQTKDQQMGQAFVTTLDTMAKALDTTGLFKGFAEKMNTLKKTASEQILLKIDIDPASDLGKLLAGNAFDLKNMSGAIDSGISGPDGDKIVNQYLMGKAMGLSDEQAWSLCGPAAGLGMAAAAGINTDASKVFNLTKAGPGQNPLWGEYSPGEYAMYGPEAFDELLRREGVEAKRTQMWPLDEGGKLMAAINALANSPMITMSGSKHYWVADQYDPSQGGFHVGDSGTAMAKYGGKEWMSMAEIEAIDSISNMWSVVQSQFLQMAMEQHNLQKGAGSDMDPEKTQEKQRELTAELQDFWQMFGISVGDVYNGIGEDAKESKNNILDITSTMLAQVQNVLIANPIKLQMILIPPTEDAINTALNFINQFGKSSAEELMEIRANLISCQIEKQMAIGGLIWKPTVALLGESGPEMVVNRSQLNNMMNEMTVTRKDDNDNSLERLVNLLESQPAGHTITVEVTQILSGSSMTEAEKSALKADTIETIQKALEPLLK